VSAERFAGKALAALAPERAIRLASAAEHVPAKPGLYAIHGAADVWRELGLGAPPDARPLYLGKAEDSLVSRDLDTHLSDRAGPADEYPGSRHIGKPPHLRGLSRSRPVSRILS
jgi:hypothetical protein